MVKISPRKESTEEIELISTNIYVGCLTWTWLCTPTITLYRVLQLNHTMPPDFRSNMSYPRSEDSIIITS